MTNFNWGFVDTRLANEYMIVLCLLRQDLYAASDLLIVAYDGVQFSKVHFLKSLISF
jgi:hypothetical protein